MHGRYEQRIFPGILVLVIFWTASLSAVTAGTTGTVRGRVDDRATKAPLAGVTVTVTAPSGASTAKTDAHGDFLFISLSPDTYVLTAKRGGYDPASVTGVTVSADNVAVADGCPKVMPLFEAKSSGFGVTERTLRASVDQGPDAGAHDCSRCANARSLRGPR